MRQCKASRSPLPAVRGHSYGGYAMRGAWTMLLAAAVMLPAGCMRAAIATAKVYPPSREASPLQKLEDENKRLKAQLDAETEVDHKLAYDLEVTRIELEKCQAALLAKGEKPAETVPAFHEYTPDHIRLGMLSGPSSWTGGADYDGMAAYLVVKDSDETTLKARGNAVFDLIDISDRRQTTLMSWAVPADVLGQNWEPLPPGYRLRLPWQGAVPWGDDAVFRVTFTDAYGHVFTASITIRLKHKPKDEAAPPIKQGGGAK